MRYGENISISTMFKISMILTNNIMKNINLLMEKKVHNNLIDKIEC